MLWLILKIYSKSSSFIINQVIIKIVARPNHAEFKSPQSIETCFCLIRIRRTTSQNTIWKWRNNKNIFSARIQHSTARCFIYNEKPFPQFTKLHERNVSARKEKEKFLFDTINSGENLIYTFHVFINISRTCWNSFSRAPIHSSSFPFHFLARLKIELFVNFFPRIEKAEWIKFALV